MVGATSAGIPPISVPHNLAGLTDHCYGASAPRIARSVPAPPRLSRPVELDPQ